MTTIDAEKLMTRLNILCNDSCPYSKGQWCEACLLSDVFDIVDDMISMTLTPCERCQEFDCAGCEHKGVHE